MAIPVAVGDIVQVTPRFNLEGQQIENVLYFQCLNADPNMLANLLLVVAHCIITHLLPALGSNCTLESVKGKIVGPAVGLEDEWLPLTTDVVTGAAVGDSEPSFVAAVISLHTNRPGRRGRGRMFIGGIPEEATTGSLINLESDLWAALAAFVACIAAAFPLRELGGAASYEWGMYSRTTAAVTKPPYPIIGYAGIVRALPKRELGTQRSRKLGRGR